MAGQVGALRVSVGADITGLQTGMKRAERQVQQSASVMQRSVNGINNSFKGLGQVAGVSLGAAGLLVGARAFLRVADAAKSLSAQLKLATAEYGSFAKANKDVRNIAEGTRSDLLATAELYAALQRNSGQLGASQQQVARATETVAKAFKISGAATSEQSAATRQLIQAFQSGVLRGDEFNSVMENAPRLAKLLAESLGVTVGELRKMAEAGELTADKLLKAFSDTKFTAAIDAEFKELPVTFDQAMTGVYNAAIITFSAFDRGGQFSNSIANFVTDGTKGFKDLEDAAFNFGKGVSDLFAALEEVRSGIGNMHGDGIMAFSALTDWSFTFRDSLRFVLQLLDQTIEAYARVINAPGNVVRGALGFQKKVYDSRFTEGFNERTKDKRTGAERWANLFRGGTGKTPPAFVPPPTKTKGSKAKKGRAAPRDRSEDVTAQFENELRQAQMDLLRATQSLSHDYIERTTISLQMLDLEKLGRDAEIDERVRRAERDAAEGKITASALEQVKTQAGILKADSKKLDALERQAVLAEQEAQRYEDGVRLDALTLELDEKKLQSELQLAETAKEQRAIQLRLLDLSYQQEKARLEAVIADQQASAAAKEDARRRLSAQSETYSNDRQGVMNSTMGPWEQFATAATDAKKLEEAYQSVAVNGVGAITDGIIDAISGAKSLGEAFREVANQIIKDLLRIMIQKMIVQAIGMATGMPTAGASGSVMMGGGTGAFFGGGGGFATGGAVRGPGSGTSDSVPARLSNGEFVINADAARKVGRPLLEYLNSGDASFAGKGGGLFGGLGGFAKFISPLAMAKHLGVLKYASPAAFLGNKMFGDSGNGGSMGGLPIAGSPWGAGMNITAGAGLGGNTFNVTVNGSMSDREARRTGGQIYAGFRAEIARSSQKGF